jgi:hypothetical protein
MMQRDEIVVEVQKRLNGITTANGHPFDIAYVFRNPEEEPSVNRMPCINIFEFPDITVDEKQRGGSLKPIYKKEFQVVLEMWYVSASAGETSRDIMTFLKSVREVIFEGGITLGGKAKYVKEEEVSRVYRPGIGNNVVGIGQVLSFQYIEDFDTL